jgi:hypothetical protein
MNKFFLAVIAASCAVIALSMRTNENSYSDEFEEEGAGDY